MRWLRRLTERFSPDFELTLIAILIFLLILILPSPILQVTP